MNKTSFIVLNGGRLQATDAASFENFVDIDYFLFARHSHRRVVIILCMDLDYY